MKKRNQLFVRLKRSKFFVSGFILSLFIIMLSVSAPFIVAFDSLQNNLAESLNAPQYFSKGWSGHILGTDNLGRDILTRVLIGSRYSLIVSIGAVSLSLILGIILGLYSGYYGGWVDNIIMRLTDIQLAIPQLLLAIAIVAVLGPSIINLIFILAVTGWMSIARLVRGQLLVIREIEFVSASRVIGESNNRIIFSQILPNITTPLVILASQRIGFTILLEANLSFLGLGVQAPTPSWGTMISDGRQYLMTAPWIIMAPGVALMLTVLAFNFIGDGLRDALDPKMKT